MKRLGLILILHVFSQPARADFINLLQADKCETIIEVFVQNQKITARLEIGALDYQWFSDVVPEKHFDGGFNDQERSKRWKRFTRSQFVLTSGSQVLQGTVKTVELRERLVRASLYTGQVDSSALNKKVVFVEIEYDLGYDISDLTLLPPMEEASQNTPANIGFVVYHKSIPVNDLRYLSTAETVHFDWHDPWYSYFENKNISRHHKSSFMSFLYVEPYEVRHEILGRIKDLEGWIDLDYEMDDMIEVEEQDSIKQLIADFLVDRNVVRIDGEARNPIIDRIQFVEVQLSGIQIMEIPRPLPYASAIIGVIFAYPDPGLPKEVTIRWDMFNEKVQRVPAMSIDPAGPWPYDLQPSDSVLKWTNFLKHYEIPTVTEQEVEQAKMHFPLFSIVFLLMLLFTLFRNRWSLKGLSKWAKFFFVLFILLGIFAYPIGFQVQIPFLKKKTYSQPEAKTLISHLLKNTYRAFDFREEGEIYDKLAICNDEPLLQRIYLDTRASMVIENQGGLEAKVDEVFVSHVESTDKEKEGLSFRCNWIVKGQVGHWGHKHQRVNQYDAVISIRPVQGNWKMYNLDIMEEKRL